MVEVFPDLPKRASRPPGVDFGGAPGSVRTWFQSRNHVALCDDLVIHLMAAFSVLVWLAIGGPFVPVALLARP